MFCIFHSDKNIKTYNCDKEKEEVFLEIVLSDEATISYPGGHTHLDYYDHKTGKYIKDNGIVEFIKEILEKNLIIKYIFRGKDLIASGIWDEENERFLMFYGFDFIVLNPIYWIRKIFGKFKKESEEIVSISWKK